MSPPFCLSKTGNSRILENSAIRIAPERPYQTGMQMTVPKRLKNSRLDRRDVHKAQSYRRGSFGLTESTGIDIVSRPSSVTGSTYSAVSKTYPHALHSLRIRESTIPAAAAILENAHVRSMEVGTTQPATGLH